MSSNGYSFIQVLSNGCSFIQVYIFVLHRHNIVLVTLYIDCTYSTFIYWFVHGQLLIGIRTLYHDAIIIDWRGPYVAQRCARTDAQIILPRSTSFVQYFPLTFQ